MNPNHLLDLKEIILNAGDLALRYFARLTTLEVSYKNPRDLVSEADLAIEKYLIDRLRKVGIDAGFYGEETGQNANQSTRWIIDPIDGTHSFLRGQAFWSISVALEIKGILCLGAVYAPKLGDLYLAEKNQGATKNGKPIHVSSIAQLSEAMVSTGFACLRAGLSENNLTRFNQVALQTLGQRRFGSAALDLCLVADAQVDIFWEMELNLYDIAAGALILLEAGGALLNFKGQPGIFPKEVLATNQLLTSQVLPYL